MTTINPEDIRLAFALAEHAHVYQLGCVGAERVTVYAQQVRAMNLAWALNELGQLNESTHVVVVGAGASGLTAALAFNRLGTSVTVLEQTEVLLPRFAGCSQRFLHPHAYEWPAPGSHERRAGLPLMDWVASSAGDVAAQLRRAWTVESAGSQRLLLQTRSNVAPIDFDTRLVPYHAPELREVRFDILVFAVGVGTERREAGTPTYWENDAVAQDIVGGPKTVLVSGNGDGALVDVVRASLLGFDHSQLMLQFLSISQRDTLEDKVAAIEAAASDPSFDLDRAFEGLDLSRIVAFLSDRIRTERRVTLNVAGPNHFRANTMALNRVLVECLRRVGLEIWRGRLSCDKTSVGWQASVDGGEGRAFDLALLRWGAENDLVRLLSAPPTTKRPPPGREAVRVPHWPKNYFSPRAPVRSTAQAPVKFDVVPLEDGFGLESRAWWMNHSGAVVGWTKTQERYDHSFFVWSGSGVPPTLGTIPGLSKTAATCINEKGEYLVASEGCSGQAFLIRPGGMTILRSIGERAMPYSVNNNSVVVGWSDDENGHCRPVIWRDGIPSLLPDPGFGGVALQINDAEDIIGEVRLIKNGPSAAARWRGGSMELLKPFAPYNSVRGFRLNTHGVAVGYLSRNGGQSDFFVWPIDEEPRVIDQGEAYGINDHGWIAGRAGTEGAFLWRDGRMHWLNDLIDKRWRMSWPLCVINDLRIVGVASRNGIDRAVLLVPRFDAM